MQPTLNSPEQQDSTLSCLLIPVLGSRLVLPNVTVAEVSPYQPPIPVEDAAKWLKGTVEWRGTMIPVIAYEELVGETLSNYSQDARIVVVNAPSGSERMRFFGLIAQGIPSQVKLEEAAIKENPNHKLIKGQAMAVTVETGHGVIPDLDIIEAELLNQNW